MQRTTSEGALERPFRWLLRWARERDFRLLLRRRRSSRAGASSRRLRSSDGSVHGGGTFILASVGMNESFPATATQGFRPARRQCRSHWKRPASAGKPHSLRLGHVSQLGGQATQSNPRGPLSQWCGERSWTVSSLLRSLFEHGEELMGV